MPAASSRSRARRRRAPPDARPPAPRARERSTSARSSDPADVRAPAAPIRSAGRHGHAPTWTPDSSASGSHTTANASIGSGIPFSSISPNDSNRAPSTRPASIFVTGDTRIPSAGALSHNRAASTDRHPEVVPVLDRRLARSQPDPHVQPLLRAPIAPLEQLLRQHRTRHAADADVNATNSPSPVFLNSRPPDASIASRNSAKYSSRRAIRPEQTMKLPSPNAR